MVNEKTKIAGARNVLAVAKAMLRASHKASLAAAVHYWNDRHITGDWTRSLRSRVSAASAMLGGASLSFLQAAAGIVRVDQLLRHIRATNYGQVARVT
jgi:hypothetical protein